MKSETEILSAIKKLLILGDSESIANPDISLWLYENNLYYLLLGNGIYNKWSFQAQLKYKLNKLCICKRLENCKKFLNFLFENKIPFAVMKGAVLSDVALGNPYFRCSSDIDFLIDKFYLEKISEFLKCSGFIQGRIKNETLRELSREDIIYHILFTHQTAPFILQIDDPYCRFLTIDLNFTIFWGELKRDICINELLQSTGEIEIDGVVLKKLNTEIEFIELCLHHYKDCNSLFLLTKNGLPLSHFVDIYMYIKNTALDLHRLSQLSLKFGVEKYIYYCLYYVNLLFEDEKVKKYVDFFTYAKDDIILNSYGLSDSERKIWDIDFINRLFNKDLSTYIKKHLNQKELMKIEINKLYM